MNKYILRLNGGIGLGAWSVKYQDIGINGVVWYCEGQLAYLPNVWSIHIFNDDDSYVGEVKRAKQTYEWRPA